MPNYVATEIGTPYVRANRIEIYYPDNGQLPHAVIHQTLAVKLADGTIRTLEELPSITATFDLAANGADPIPLVDPGTGQPLGPSTSLQSVMLGILAVVRQRQLAGNA
jgi:hypothetical protein